MKKCAVVFGMRPRRIPLTEVHSGSAMAGRARTVRRPRRLLYPRLRRRPHRLLYPPSALPTAAPTVSCGPHLRDAFVGNPDYVCSDALSEEIDFAYFCEETYVMFGPVRCNASEVCSDPTSSPTAMPTAVPTSSPSTSPSAAPTSSPSASPSAVPTEVPTTNAGMAEGSLGVHHDTVSRVIFS